MPEPASRVSVRVNEHDAYACVCVHVRYLFGCEVPLCLSQHLVPDHELLDGGRPQQGWVVQRV